MRVFVAGATGAIGRRLMPRLVGAGHEVHGMTRSESKRAMLHELGAVPVVADALDPDRVADAVGRARPDVIVNQLTAFAGEGMRGLKHRVAMTNRLRTEGTDHLLSAGQAVGVRRFVAQSNYALYARTGGPVKTEEDPLDPTPPRKQREAAAAIFHLEEAVLGAGWTEGIVLRYGAFYGPGTGMGPGGEMHEMIRKRRFPLVGDGGGVWSFIHVADAAEATAAAVERGGRGVYNVVDDDPAPVAEWLPALTRMLSGNHPEERRVDAGEVQRDPRHDGEDQVGRAAPDPEPAQGEHQRQPQHRQRPGPHILGVEERDDTERADIVGYGEGQQEHPQLRRDGPAEQREDAEQERGVGGDHDPPRRRLPAAEVERHVHQRGHDQPGERGQRRDRGAAPVGELA